MSNAFSRSISRPQPHPKICISKDPTPIVPPRFDPGRGQLAINIDGATTTPAFLVGGIATIGAADPFHDWIGIAFPGTATELQLAATYNQVDASLSLVMAPTQPTTPPTFWLATLPDFIPGEPYDSHNARVTAHPPDIDDGQARLIV